MQDKGLVVFHTTTRSQSPAELGLRAFKTWWQKNHRATNNRLFVVVCIHQTLGTVEIITPPKIPPIKFRKNCFVQFVKEKSKMKKEFIDKSMLIEPEIESNKNFKSTIYISKECYQIIESLILQTNGQSRNRVITDAIKFYYGYISGEINLDYLCGTFGNKLDATIKRSDDRTSRILYKMAVELSMLTRICATDKILTKETYDRMRKNAAQDVKTTNGILDIFTASLESGK